VLAALHIAQQVPATDHNVRDGFTLYPSPQPAEPEPVSMLAEG